MDRGPHHLPPTIFHVNQKVPQGGQLPLPAHESAQGAPRIHLQREMAWPKPHYGISSDPVRRLSPERPLTGLQLTPALDQRRDLGGDEDFPRRCVAEQSHRPRQCVSDD